MTAGLKAIFLDAGNTLIFPDLERTLGPLLQRNLRPTTDQLYAAERVAKTELDALNLSQSRCTDLHYWQIYYQALLKDLAIDDAGLQQELVAATRTSAHWNHTRPDTREALQRMARRYLLGVISNSDGHIAELLHSCGIGDCFLTFTDSGRIGHEKPSAVIFRAALQQLQVAAEESLYVGDIYSVDYLGATRAGMSAVLFDVSGAYRDRQLPRVESLLELESRLG